MANSRMVRGLYVRGEIEAQTGAAHGWLTPAPEVQTEQVPNLKGGRKRDHRSLFHMAPQRRAGRHRRYPAAAPGCCAGKPAPPWQTWSSRVGTRPLVHRPHTEALKAFAMGWAISRPARACRLVDCTRTGCGRRTRTLTSTRSRVAAFTLKGRCQTARDAKSPAQPKPDGAMSLSIYAGKGQRSASFFRRTDIGRPQQSG